MITQETINKINDLPIVKVVERFHEAPKKSGANYVCRCPFHTDTHPSFIISPAKNISTCFVCAQTYSNISFVMEKEQIDFRTAITKIADAFNIEIKTTNETITNEDKERFKELESLYIANNFAAEYYHNNLLGLIEKYFPGKQLTSRRFLARNYSYASEEKEIIHYILQRYKGSIELLKSFKIGYAAAGYSNLYNAAKKAGFQDEILLKAGLVKKRANGKFMDAFVFRPLIIPIKDKKNKIAGFAARKKPWDTATDKNGEEYPKFINTAETDLYKKSDILYGFDYACKKAALKADKIYIVEGNTDKSSLYYLNVKNAVAKGGTALTDNQIESLKKVTKNICLLDDGDNEGQLAMLRTGEALTYAACNVTVLQLPKKQDPDSFFKSEKHFNEYKSENEKDYIVDIVALSYIDDAHTIQQKASAREAIAKLVLQKPKNVRNDYINALVAATGVKTNDWKTAIRVASFQLRNQGINLSEETNDIEAEADNSKENRKKHNFYFIETDSKNEPKGIKIDERKFLMRLKSMQVYVFEQKNKIIKISFGFFTYALSQDEDEIIYIQLTAGRIKKVSINFIKKTFFSFLRLLKPFNHQGFTNEGAEWDYLVTSQMLENKFLQSITNLFSPNKLLLFPDREIKILQDTLDKHYTFFKNCFIVSNADGCELFDYADMKEGYVWEDSVLDREYHEPKDDEPGVFEKFVHDISGNDFNLQTNKSEYPELERYNSLLIAGGYLMHNYTEMKRKALILTQGRISEDDTSEGREGKTLFVKSLGQRMLNREPKKSKTFIYIPGKDLKSDDKHKWQDLELNTTCVLYDDPPAWLNFESLYNASEDSFKVEKKQQQSTYVEARICITTNRPINRDSGSSRDRSCVIELDSIYSADYSPEDKYKHFFFRDWKGKRADEWNKFSKYVVGTMLPAYFRNNCKLLEPASKNLYRNELLQISRRLAGTTAVVFWLDTLVHGNATIAPYFKISESYKTKDLIEKLAKEQDIADNKKLKRNFAKIVRTYFDKENIQYEQSRDLTGIVLKIIGGLPSAIEVNQQHVADYINNTDFIFDEIANKEYITNITDSINKEFKTNYPVYAVKSTIEKLNADAPF